nr:uncharacterized protein LOC113401365 isoform X5 [Vanessa tameamea]
MKSLSATALLTLAVIAECLGAQDRSRQRSGSSRSVPKTANIKRDTDFDCPEEFGYYPHPTDCTLYYVCVFGGALLESCTGGLMYSHELQTCDWPRNVGCDATGAVVAEDLERLNEREPPLYPPRRNPPPPPRTQPNPIITSRGQPKFNRQEYEQQQQLYAEVDDLPPVEEIENDRQQRVYRGQPSTIGQVQKDRDGYGSQAISSGRTLNSNIIPASINQNSKIGSFSFGTQVDERRTASLTQAPQTYRGGKYDDATDSSDRPIYFSTDTLKVNDIITNTISRKKREIRDPIVNVSKTPDELSKRHDNDEVMEYIEFDEHSTEDEYDEENLDESERGKRQIRFYVKNGHKIPTKNWQNAKPLKILNFPQFTYNPNIQSQRFQPIYQTNNYDGRNNQKPYLSNNNYFTLDNAFPTYSNDNSQTVRPFKASMPDPSKQTFSQNNAPTQIITKSPPISSLLNNQNPFSTLVGGFYNNILKGNDNRNNNNLHSQSVSPTKQANLVSFPDSSLLSSSIVTGKPIQATSSTRVLNNSPKTVINNEKPSRKPILMNNNKPKEIQEQDYDEDDSIEEEENSSEEEDENNEYSQNFQPDTSHLPYGYTNPSNKYANIQNPFANPNFNFDSFLAKLQENHYSVIGVTTKKPTKEKNPERVINSNNNNNNNVFTTVAYSDSGLRSSTLKYKGISTPKPFTMPASLSNEGSDQGNLNFVQKQTQHSHQEKDIQRPQNYHQSQQVTQDQNYNRQTQKGAGFPLESLKPRLKPPNFNDDRQLPISHSFNAAIKSTMQPTRQTDLSQYLQSVTQKPYTIISGTGSPIAFSTPNNYNIVTLQTNLSSRKPYITSTISPMNGLILSFSQSTPNPLSNIANQHLSTLQQFWNNPSTDISVPKITLSRPNPVTETPNTGYKSLPIQISTQMVNKNVLSTNTTNEPPKRKPIPKPSPEMNDYYYDEEDEQYYYEPVVKPKYMPSSEIKPQRPPMAQNYQEYEDTSYDEDTNQRVKPENSAKPNKYYPFKQEAVTKNHNDVSVVTKTPYKQSYKNVNGKIPVPVMMVLVNFSDSMSEHPDVSGYRVVHNNPRNRTVHLRKPIRTDNRPNTVRPPKYLNHTTLRPYTLRHRLAKPTTEKNQNDLDEENKKNRGRVRHHNIVAQMLFTTPRDSYKQETRFTKTNHDDRTNRLEPTESITPTSYTATPRPKMLYNGSQTYSPDQYDPYYAVYDEDGELYKDTDYVQHYNTASLRPAVQQTYRGTPPPVRRPVETYSPRPVSPDDYDDALIQGQISNQNQYQSSVRQPARPNTSTRGRGSAHYSTSGASDSAQQTPNRGTPPTRSRPTLKPSTAIVAKVAEVDIYTNPPSRPAPVYPQPTPDKTAAKCRKDVCLLPDCFCGGKDIPGELPVDKIPQIVLLTFDDSVNDLNKGLYGDLFEKGRVNPNGCPISATFYVSHEWTDYSQVQNLYSAGHEMASHTVSHSFGEQFSQKKWNREIGGQREILAAYGGVKLEDVRGMRAPFLSVGGNKMFKMLYDSNFTYDSSLPVYENKPPSWPYTLDYKLFHDCMIPPCPTKSYPGVWEVPMVMWQDLNGGRCSMGDACANPPDSDGVYKMILKNFDRHYTSNRAPFGLFYHAAWFTQPHHKEGFIKFLDFINQMSDVWIVTNWQALQWVRDPTPISRMNNFQPFQCNYQDRPKKCNNPKVCNLWHKSGVRYMRTCQPCPEIYPWTGKTGIRSSRIDNDIEE